MFIFILIDKSNNFLAKKDRFYAKRPTPKFQLEFRNYSLPVDFPVVALLEGQFQFPKLATDAHYMHFHNCIELSYCWSGKGILSIEDQEFPFSAGDILLIPPYASHITRHVGDDQPDRSEYLYFDPEMLLEENSHLTTSLKYFQHNFPGFPYVIQGESAPEVVTVLQYALTEMHNRSSGYQDAVRGLITTFLIYMLRRFPSEVYHSKESQLSRRIFSLSAAVKYINAHYMEHISPQVLSDLCFMSLTNFRRLFKSVLGISPLDYINRVRIRKSQELLYSTELSILDISLSVGFETLSSFNRHFSEIVGTSPLKWRKYCRSITKKNCSFSDFMQEHGQNYTPPIHGLSEINGHSSNFAIPNENNKN